MAFGAIDGGSNPPGTTPDCHVIPSSDRWLPPSATRWSSKNEGRLVENEDYHTVVTVLELVQKGNLSKRKAARRLDTSRATTSRALNRAELYGI